MQNLRKHCSVQLQSPERICKWTKSKYKKKLNGLQFLLNKIPLEFEKKSATQFIYYFP